MKTSKPPALKNSKVKWPTSKQLKVALRHAQARERREKKARKSRGVPPDVKPQVLYPPEVLPNLPPAPTIPYIA